jgi:hypothetical protein
MSRQEPQRPAPDTLAVPVEVLRRWLETVEALLSLAEAIEETLVTA